MPAKYGRMDKSVFPVKESTWQCTDIPDQPSIKADKAIRMLKASADLETAQSPEVTSKKPPVSKRAASRDSPKGVRIGVRMLAKKGITFKMQRMRIITEKITTKEQIPKMEESAELTAEIKASLKRTVV